MIGRVRQRVGSLSGELAATLCVVNMLPALRVFMKMSSLFLDTRLAITTDHGLTEREQHQNSSSKRLEGTDAISHKNGYRIMLDRVP